MTKEVDVAVIHAFVQRFKAMPFKTAKHMVSFKQQLVAALDDAIRSKDAAIRAAKEKKDSVARARLAVQSTICAKWARAMLTTDDLVRLRSKKGEYQVIANNSTVDSLIVLMVGTRKDADGNFIHEVIPGSGINVMYSDVYKIKHHNKWLDVYSIASGNQGQKT